MKYLTSRIVADHTNGWNLQWRELLGDHNEVCSDLKQYKDKTVVYPSTATNGLIPPNSTNGGKIGGYTKGSLNVIKGTEFELVAAELFGYTRGSPQFLRKLRFDENFTLATLLDGYDDGIGWEVVLTEDLSDTKYKFLMWRAVLDLYCVMPEVLSQVNIVLGVDIGDYLVVMDPDVITRDHKLYNQIEIELRRTLTNCRMLYRLNNQPP